MSRLLIEVLIDNRAKGRFLLHEFVLMPDHFHLILTPAPQASLEKAVQFVKGGFSYRVKKDLKRNLEVWQAGFTNHRIRDSEDYRQHCSYIRQNPVKAGLAASPERFPWSSAFSGAELDEAPPGLKP
jgi:putative transposase